MTLQDTGTAVLGDELFESSASESETRLVNPRIRPNRFQETAVLGLSTNLRFASAERLDMITRTVSELERLGSPVVERDRQELNGDFDSMAEKRAVLLARLCGSQPSLENEARFEMLTQRLRRVAPRIGAEEIAALDEIVTDVERISATIAEIKGR